ncbi:MULTISPECIES: NAD(P)-dependent alcohol dehydrogenase [unclassified Modestobacter]|uniref:NAD(P)-dependent alcohol dehydrogenase n=1 Tax=unclassified Modestobacter TaxID=2643866 RepID=UPI0022AA87EF|nr:MULTISPECIES: NAD(P)-dependent alcohol dehydrogenase [unclassified Modestobacter]MCZ2824033.1 NAD(P)-dependent alcohol dehydrogenase [Modestobacter sp. VKM Ac-2981]MCZ2852278.1 NAD(P)-dependent alcohol dehydrogenase [Modestobacter sp. VKM Ac-2982]
MLAAVRERYGPPELVRVAEVPTPVAGPGELLVRVRCTTVNRTDSAYRAGTPRLTRLLTGVPRPRATVLGTEFAGEVVAVGAGVPDSWVGERVFGYVEGRFGAHAEFLTVPADGFLSRVPDGVPDDVAAAATEGAHYAVAVLCRARIEPGEDVLVYGATGAIGSATVQLLRVLGAHVTAVCDGSRADLVRGLGAERVIDRTTEEFLADPHRYDVVVDAVGKTSFRRCRRLLRPRGRFVSTDLGRFWQNPVLALVTPLSRGRRVVFPVPLQDPALPAHLRDLLASGELRPVLDERRWPLSGIVEAYRYVDSGQKTGSVVVDVG